MKNETQVLWVVAIFALLVWMLLKDREEIFLSFAMPGVGTVAAAGRKRAKERTIEGDAFKRLD